MLLLRERTFAARTFVHLRTLKRRERQLDIFPFSGAFHFPGTNVAERPKLRLNFQNDFSGRMCHGAGEHLVRDPRLCER